VVTKAEAALHAAIGIKAFLQAKAHLANRELREVRWDPATRRAHGRVNGIAVGSAVATVRLGADGSLEGVDGSCTCRLRPPCNHPAALLLAVLPLMPIVPAPRRPGGPPAGKPAWESALATRPPRIGPTGRRGGGSASAGSAIPESVAAVTATGSRAVHPRVPHRERPGGIVAPDPRVQ